MTTLTRFCLIVFICLFFSAFAKSYANMASDIQKVQIDFTMPNGYVRHLLLGFTTDNAASDGIDYGYDAANIDTFPDDLNWMIEEKRFVIQGVGAFNETKKYPLGLFLKNSGEIKIELKGTYLIDASVNFFIYDSELETYTRINELSYTKEMQSGEYLDRFYLVFNDNSSLNEVSNSSLYAKTLSIEDITLKDTKISYLNDSKQLYINTNDKYIVKHIHVYNLNGQKVFTLSHVNSKLIKIPLQISQIKYGIVAIETDQGGLRKKIILN